MGLDRIGSPPGRTVFAAVTRRWPRGPAGPYCPAARRRSSWRWRAIAGSRYECIDLGLSPGDLWGFRQPAVSAGQGKVTAWLYFRPRGCGPGDLCLSGINQDQVIGSLAGTPQQRARFHLLRRSVGLQPRPLLIAERRERLIAVVGHQLSRLPCGSYRVFRAARAAAQEL